MSDVKFEESGLLAEFFGFGKVQLESSTKYICKCMSIVTGLVCIYCRMVTFEPTAFFAFFTLCFFICSY